MGTLIIISLLEVTIKTRFPEKNPTHKWQSLLQKRTEQEKESHLDLTLTSKELRTRFDPNCGLGRVLIKLGYLDPMKGSSLKSVLLKIKKIKNILKKYNTDFNLLMVKTKVRNMY